MSETPSQNELPFVPGDILTFSDVSELRDFEDLIAGIVRPDYDDVAWYARTDIEDLIRPKIKGHIFNGQLREISLTVMEEPYLRLVDATERGISFSKKGGVGGISARLSGEHSLLNIPKYIGFQFQANAHSTGRGVIGKISTELWFFPLNAKIHKAGTTTINHRKGGEYKYTYKQDSVSYPIVNYDGKTVKRVVAKPQYEAEAFIALSETSRQIGFAVLQKAMMNPISTPMRD